MIEAALTKLDEHTRLKLTAMLRKFIDGEDRSKEFAAELEVAFEQVFDEEQPFDEFVGALARYRPGGGDLLYDEDQMAEKCRRILRELCERKIEMS